MICKELQECCADETYDCKNKRRCIVYRDFRKQAVCEENRKRYNLINDKGYKIALFHMDGGIIYDESQILKCNFLYIVYDSDCPTAIFVELKGNNLYHAIKQLKASIDMYGSKLNRRICVRIICSSVPRLYNDPIFKNLKKQLIRQYNGTLEIFERNKEEKYSEL